MRPGPPSDNTGGNGVHLPVVRGVLPAIPGRGFEGVGSEPAPLNYHWVTETDSKKYALYIGDIKLGQYDPATDTYRRYHTDGTLSKPVRKPWTAVPNLKREAAETDKAPAPSTADKEPAAEESSEDNSWITYAVGGGVGSLVLLLVMLQPRRG
jgi:hypothetical protein